MGSWLEYRRLAEGCQFTIERQNGPDATGGRVETAPSSFWMRRISPDFAPLEFENDLQTATKGTRALTRGYKVLIHNDLLAERVGFEPHKTL
jgi:hypothetical protein